MRKRLIVLLLGSVVLGFVVAAGPVLSAGAETSAGKIAFASNRADPIRFDIWSMNADGTGKTRLTTDGRGDLFPAWSPDSGKIAFRSRRDGNSEIYVMNADGSNQERLTNNPATDDMPAWSPDGRKIAFSSARAGTRNLWLMNADGSGAVQVTTGPGFDIRPNWSPDGDRIVFTSIRPEGDAVFVLTLGSGKVTQVTDFALNGGGADWSADGNQFVIADNLCSTCDASRIFVVKQNGKGLAQVTNSELNDILPAWSGDSRSIAFVRSDLDFTFADIWVVQSDGAGAVDLSNNPSGVADVDPAWSGS